MINKEKPGEMKSPVFFCIFAKSNDMETIKTIEEIQSAGGEEKKLLEGYKLCYIDDIPQTYWDYTPEAKAYRETEEWKEQDRLRDEKLHREGHMSSDDPEFGYYANPILRRGSESQEYPNPVYIEGKQEFYAYFTPIPLDEQWGDDWDDYPYEYNAEPPYDSLYEEKDERGKWKEYEIIKVPFFFEIYKVYLPNDWVNENSPFSVRDINAGAVAWVYYPGKERKTNKGSICIYAGENPFEFVKKIEKINKTLDD